MSDRATAFMHEYVTALDERRFDDWLALFTEDAYYEMLLARDERDGTNLLAIGEDKQRLAGRIEVGQDIERDATTHIVSAVVAHAENDEIRMTAAFLVVRRLAIHYAGRYRMRLVATDAGLKIRRCTVVLENHEIRGTGYLPV